MYFRQLSIEFFFYFQVCLGFIENTDDKGVRHRVTNNYVTDGDFEIEIAGIR